MKIKLVLLTTAIALCGAVQLLGQTAAPPDANSQDNGTRFGKLQRADEIIARDVRDPQGNKIGTVKDLAVELQNGRIVEVIVGTGGILGVEQKYVAIPPSLFTYVPQSQDLQANVDKTKLAQAPAFKYAQWDVETSQANVAECYQYFGARPWFATPGETPAANQVQLGQVQRCDKLIGSTVRNMQSDRLGRVSDLIVDVPAGRVVEVVVGTGGFLGVRDQYSAVPPQSFRPGAERDTVMLDTTKEALAKSPHFMSSQWGQASNEQYVLQVYSAYNVTPYFNDTGFNATGEDTGHGAYHLEHPGANNTAQNPPPASTLTPLNQGTSESDIDTTRQIRREVMEAPGLSVDARNCKIITLDGKVTLRGTVDTEDEKTIIGNIAATVVSRANVNNQLMVQNTSRSSAQ